MSLLYVTGSISISISSSSISTSKNFFHISLWWDRKMKNIKKYETTTHISSVLSLWRHLHHHFEPFFTFSRVPRIEYEAKMTTATIPHASSLYQIHSFLLYILFVSLCIKSKLFFFTYKRWLNIHTLCCYHRW